MNIKSSNNRINSDWLSRCALFALVMRSVPVNSATADKSEQEALDPSTWLRASSLRAGDPSVDGL